MRGFVLVDEIDCLEELITKGDVVADLGLRWVLQYVKSPVETEYAPVEVSLIDVRCEEKGIGYRSLALSLPEGMDDAKELWDAKDWLEASIPKLFARTSFEAFAKEAQDWVIVAEVGRGYEWSRNEVKFWKMRCSETLLDLFGNTNVHNQESG